MISPAASSLGLIETPEPVFDSSPKVVAQVTPENPTPDESAGPELTAAQTAQIPELLSTDRRAQDFLADKVYTIESIGPWTTGGDNAQLVGAFVTTPAANPRCDATGARPIPRTSAGIVYLVSGSVRAAKSADDWPVVSGVVRDATKGKGNYGLGSGTASQARQAGESWVGEGYRVASDGKTLVISDGLRTFRPPTWKPKQGKYQANFEYWNGERVGKPFGNGHLDITDMNP